MKIADKNSSLFDMLRTSLTEMYDAKLREEPQTGRGYIEIYSDETDLIETSNYNYNLSMTSTDEDEE